MLYQAYLAHSDLSSPLQMLAHAISIALAPDPEHSDPVRRTAAACELLATARITHVRPPFGIDAVQVQGREAAVVEAVELVLPFGSLLHFRKPEVADQPRVLLVAPLSGHFATLLRDTIRTLLVDHDVYVTDWANARDVPIWAGRFGMDDYTDYVMRFMRHIGPNAHMMAICQPCVAALAACALMADEDDPAQPRSLTLMAGPVDTRINPTSVNVLANSKPIDWFESRLISRVPWRFPGALRRVYPGALQLAAFMNMNAERHRQALLELYRHRCGGEHEKADALKRFYDEYFAVLDLTAEFYLETVERVFQKHLLPRGELSWRGRRVDPAAIRRTALLTVEGERDDICSIGQTVAAHDLCRNIRPYLKQHHVQTGVGHYGVFSGRRWSQQIAPVVRDLVHSTTA